MDLKVSSVLRYENDDQDEVWFSTAVPFDHPTEDTKLYIPRELWEVMGRPLHITMDLKPVPRKAIIPE